MKRNGFTLLELSVALAVAGIVALLVYGAMAVALDTERRLTSAEEATRVDVAWRVVLHDALRNVRTSAEYGMETLALEHRLDATGGPIDRITFVTAGGTPPLTPDVDWRVTLEADARGLRLTAQPLGSDAPPTMVRWEGVAGLDVRALGEGGWRDTWPGGPLPRGLSLTRLGEGRPAGPPLVVALPERRR